MKIAFLIIIACCVFVGIVVTGVYHLGVKAGMNAGYSLCVSESDDDHPKTRAF